MNPKYKPKEEIITLLPAIPEGAAFSIHDIDNVNPKPHPFCITEKHVAYAADHNGGRLDESVCNKFPCGIGRSGSPIRNQQPCTLRFEEHTSERVVFIKVVWDGPIKDVPGLYDWLKAASDIIAAGNIKVDGFAFVK